MLILSERKLLEEQLVPGTNVVLVTTRTVKKYNGNQEVVAVVGSRAMSRLCADLDFPALKLFQLTSAGFDGVPLDSYAKKGIPVANAGAVYSTPIAETVVFGVLQVAKRLRPNPNNRRFKLRRHYTEISELAEKKVLIMGCGNIGSAIADRLLPFEMNIEGYDPYCASKPQYSHMLRSREELMSEIGKYDYVISTLPDNETTHGFVDTLLISRMKRTAVIVNVGRMAVIDRKALYLALREKRIGGAVLDMFEKIPNPITNPFRRLKNVIVLPGVAAISKEVNERLVAHMTENVIAVIAEKQAKNVINGV